MRIIIGLLLLAATAGGLQAQQRPVYKARQLTAADLERRQRIPEWKPGQARSETALPPAVDNSRLKYFPAVFNQSGNSCSQASGVRYAFTYEVNRLLDRAADASADNVFSYHFTWNYLNNGANEGSHAELGYDMMKTGGAATLADMPDESAAVSSTTWLTGYDRYLRAMHYRVKHYEKFSLKTPEGIARLKRYLYNRGEAGSTGGIVTFACLSGDWKEQAYSGPSATGLKRIIAGNGTDGAHALTITGYDDTVECDLDGDGRIADDEKGAFVFVNSWGRYWGSEGRCYYPYKLFLTPASEGGIADLSAMALMVEPEIHEPKVVFKVKISYTSRNDLFFRLGVGDGGSDSPAAEWGYPMMMMQGGDHYMRGGGTAEERKTIEVAMDFTDHLAEADRFDRPKYFLKVRKLAVGDDVGKGTIEEFSVVDYRTGHVYTSSGKQVEIGGETVLSTDGEQTDAVSASPCEWLLPDGTEATGAPFILKSARGEQFKLRFEHYDSGSGAVEIKYQKLP